jgi:hypothetical protein
LDYGGKSVDALSHINGCTGKKDLAASAYAGNHRTESNFRTAAMDETS